MSGDTADLNCLKFLGLLKIEQPLSKADLETGKCGAGWGRVIPRCHKLGRK